MLLTVIFFPCVATFCVLSLRSLEAVVYIGTFVWAAAFKTCRLLQVSRYMHLLDTVTESLQLSTSRFGIGLQVYTVYASESEVRKENTQKRAPVLFTPIYSDSQLPAPGFAFNAARALQHSLSATLSLPVSLHVQYHSSLSSNTPWSQPCPGPAPQLYIGTRSDSESLAVQIDASTGSRAAGRPSLRAHCTAAYSLIRGSPVAAADNIAH